MSFKPTVEYMQGLFNPTTNLMSAIDPDVKWMIADEKKDPLTKSGIYNLESWGREVMMEFGAKTAGPPDITAQEIEVFGQKAIVEATSIAIGNNGKKYSNRFCFIFIFSAETGKIVTVREYLNTAVVKQMMEEN